MKDLISAILSAEEELQEKAKSTNEKVQEINGQADAKIDQFIRNREEELLREKNKKTNSLEDEIREYGEKLHKDINREMKAKEKKLNAKRSVIYSRIINSIIS